MNNLILAGTEKSGTTSVYHYLNAHPQIAGSAHKETDYFRSAPPHALEGYEAMFPKARPGQVRMEASPGYLSDSACTAPAIAELLPNAKLLFILRDPIDRLISSFRFHKSRFLIPEAIQFDNYIDLCMRYEDGKLSARQAGLKEWFLRVPDAGLYAKHLRDYFACFPRKQIKILTLEALQRDPRAFMGSVCLWAGLDEAFYDNFDFIRANVAFNPRLLWLQRIGLWVNYRLEPFFNRHPAIKQQIISWYKTINSRRIKKTHISPETENLLVNYYVDDVGELIEIVGPEADDARGWLSKRYVL